MVKVLVQQKCTKVLIRFFAASILLFENAMSPIVSNTKVIEIICFLKRINIKFVLLIIVPIYEKDIFL